MLNLDPAKLLVIAIVAIILLGPDRLPQVARQIGGLWRSFTDYRQRMESQVRTAIPDLPSSAEISRLARNPSALLNHLSAMSPDAAEIGDPLSPIPPDDPFSTDATTSTDPPISTGAVSDDPSVTLPPLAEMPVQPAERFITAPSTAEPSLSADPGLN